MDDVPAGHEKLLYISSMPGPSQQQIQSIVQQAPGAVWYILGEPNRQWTVSQVLSGLHDLYETIKAADPTAKITSPSILNWDFTCIGCGGYTRGDVWLNDFINTYETQYGEKPPIDVWAIDTYPIDWENTPNNSPSKPALYNGEFVPHWYIVTQQLEGLRQYLDTLGEYGNKPIWITEVAVHWGYLDWTWVFKETGADCNSQPAQVKINECRLDPTGNYHPHLMSDYPINVLNWLDDQGNAASLNIEKWFFFITWADLVTPNDYTGITFFDGRDQGAPLNCLGSAYRARAFDEPRVKCDASGNTIPE